MLKVVAIKYNFSIMIFLIGIGFSGIGCNQIYNVFFRDNSETEVENDRLGVENTSLKVSLDSLLESYELLFRDFTAIKNKDRIRFLFLTRLIRLIGLIR